jgi:DNA-directed RNA polymerase subunit E'/Rpb7
MNKALQKPQEKKVYGVYIKSILTMKTALSINEIGKNIKHNLERTISKRMEGRCIAEGFIKPDSVRVTSYSAGNVNSDSIEFQTVFECMICHPVEGMQIECITKTITKAGIHAEVIDDTGVVPLTIFIARDHHFTDKYFGTIKEKTKITVRVIGVRYELNDPYICVIGKLIEPSRVVPTKGGDVGAINITGDDAYFHVDNGDDIVDYP